MKPDLLDLLRCPITGERLSLRSAEIRDGEVVRGELVSAARPDIVYPISDGVPRFIRSPRGGLEESTRQAFGYEWTHFAQAYEFNREELRDLFAPFVELDFLKGKTILDAGCGSGMYTRVLEEFGPRRVVALDYSRAIDVARSRLGPAADCVQGSILEPCFAEGSFDFIMSKGVLHHLPEPEKGFAHLTRLLKPGGSILIWVYGRSNNRGFSQWLTPFRRWIFSRLPLSLERLCALLVAAPLFIALKTLYRPARRWNLKPLQAVLPYYALLSQQSLYPFKHVHFGVFDQMTAPIAHYYDKEQIDAWFARAGLKNAKVVDRWEMSWRGFGTR